MLDPHHCPNWPEHGSGLIDPALALFRRKIVSVQNSEPAPESELGLGPGSETQTLDFRGAGKCSSATALPLSEEDNLLCIAEVVQVGNQGLLLFR